MPRRMPIAAIATLIGICSHPVLGQDISACNGLLNAGLINQTSESVTSSQAGKDFDEFCSTDKEYSSRFSGKSQAFQASFSYAGFGVGGGASNASTSGGTDETFRAVCKNKRGEFINNFTRSFAARDGTYVATAYTNCVKLITDSGNPLLWGTARRTDQNDEHFILLLEWHAGRNTPSTELEVSSLNSSPPEVKCFRDNALKIDAVGAPINGSLTLTCKKPNGVDAVGVISVRNKGTGYQPRPLAFRVDTVTPQSSAEKKILDEISRLRLELNHAAQRTVPAGTIIAWSGKQGSIPAGWAICDGTNGTPDLRARFIMGASNITSVGALGGANQRTLRVQIPALDLATGGRTHSKALRMENGNGIINHQTGVNYLVNSFTVPGSAAVTIDTRPAFAELIYIIKL